MNQSSQTRRYLIYVICAASFVYVVGHWPALTNRYVINDDVRQQIYWMQQWNDPELFQDDLLSRYARNYVPWGVQAVYYLASPFMNPVQFSKVVAGILYVVTAAFLFGLALQFRNEIAALFVICAFFFFSTFMRKISGGLPQSFAFPLLLAYLFFLARENLWGCAIVILLESVFNPYIFVLCLTTHFIFLVTKYSAPVIVYFRNRGLAKAPRSGTIRRLILVNAPVAVGVALMALKYIYLKPAEFGNIVTWSAMADKIEYTDLGRYGILPGPSLIYEVIRPWIFVSPAGEQIPILGWIGFFAAAAMVVFAFTRPNQNIDLSGFRVFGYLLPASFILYFLSYLLMMRLFLPRRYVEFSLNVVYCMATGVSFAIILEYLGLRRKFLVALAVVLVGLGAARNWNVGIYDYSRYAPLYTFLESVPKTSLIAGHPELMDNVPTFARRKAFVTYELSHTWSDKYWEIIKNRTFDLFRAYYSGKPEEIRNFGRRYGIDYLIVRDSDFPPQSRATKQIYFEPFNTFIHRLVDHRSHFAALDSSAFPAVYSRDGIRVLKIGPSP
jgi:hypothetical protein